MLVMGRLQVVGSGVDEIVEVDVGAGKLLVGDLQFLVELLHLLASQHLVGDLEGKHKHTVRPAVFIKTRLLDVGEVAVLELAGSGVEKWE